MPKHSKAIDSTIDYDKYGHCILCSEDLKIEEVIDGEVAVRMSPRYQEIEFLLDDGSHMRVSICKECRKSYDSLKDNEFIMQKVYRGWQHETQKLVEDPTRPRWTEHKREDYLRRYSNKHILINTEGLGDDVLLKVLAKHKEDKKKVKSGSNNQT